MSTKNSPIGKLRREAKNMAERLKRFEKGDFSGVPDPAGKLAAARLGPKIKVGLYMDDKVVPLEMEWVMIRDLPMADLIDFIFGVMREKMRPVN